MPAVGFICPGTTDKVAARDCFERCVQGKRCLTLATLRQIFPSYQSDKPASGVTSMLNGTRMEFLRRTAPYYIDPYDYVYMIRGAAAHAELEAGGEESTSLVEARFELNGVRGVIDSYEVQEGEGILTDYKLAGSFAVARALGVVVAGKRPDPTGEIYKRSGRWGKAGEPKMVTAFKRQASAVKMLDWELQLNYYRLMIEAEGLPVDRMQIEAVVRDGNTLSARSRGLASPVYLIPVRRYDDQEVKDYFTAKRQALLEAHRTGQMPPPCAEEETWEGRRCERYCEVWEHCDAGRKRRNKELALELFE